MVLYGAISAAFVHIAARSWGAFGAVQAVEPLIADLTDRFYCAVYRVNSTQRNWVICSYVEAMAGAGDSRRLS
jgi:hypothetical protein